MNYEIEECERDYFDWLVKDWVKEKGYKIYIIHTKKNKFLEPLTNPKDKDKEKPMFIIKRLKK